MATDRFGYVSQREGEDEDRQRRLPASVLDRLIRQRTIIVAGEVDMRLADRINSQILVLDGEDSEKPITLFINSPGGDADAGFAMYDMLRFVTSPTRTVSAGLCASAAVMVLLATGKEHRFAMPNSRILIHQPSTAIRGDVSDIQIEASELLKCRARINQIISEATGQDVKKVEEDTKRNYWRSASEAQEYGLVGKVLNSRDELR